MSGANDSPTPTDGFTPGGTITKTHIVFASGGIGSYITGKRVKERAGSERTLFLFNDTRTEDRDLYRFLVQTVSLLCGWGTEAAEALRLCSLIPEFPHPDFKAAVEAVHREAAAALPDLVWLADGRDLWELFADEKFIANTRVDLCSKTLKRDQGDRWIKANFKPEEVALYFGIDHSERHRFFGTEKKPGIQKRLLPFESHAPLCDPPHLSKCEMLKECEREGIDPPRIYDEGFPHNNCGGFCVKSGHAQFAHLLKTRPETFAFHAEKEAEFRLRSGKDVSVMRDRRGGTVKALPMYEFQRQVESGEREVDPRDWGKGCQCFLPDDEEGAV